MDIKIVVENFGIIGSGEYVFGEGLNAVLGANGTGKSTLVNALYFAITGASLDKVDTVSDLITWGYGYATVSLVTDDYVVKRTITSTGTISHRLTILNEEPSRKMTRKNEINEWLMGYYNIDSLDALDNIYFSQQLAADNFIMSTTATRLDIMMKLFGLSKVDKARDILQAAVQSIRVEMVSDDLYDQLKATKVAAENSLEAARADLEEKQHEYEKSFDDSGDLSIIAEKAPLDEDIAAMDLDIRMAKDAVSAITTAKDAIKVPPAPDASAVGMYNKYLEIEKDLAKAEKAVASMPCVELSFLQQLQEIVDTIGEMKHQTESTLSRLRSDIESFANGFCPTCHSSAESIGFNLEASTSDCKTLEDALKQQQMDLVSATAELRQQEKAFNDRKTAAAVLEKVRESRDSLAKYKNFDHDQYKQDLREYDQLSKQYQDACTDLKVAENSLSSLELRRASMLAIHAPVSRDQKIEAQKKLSFNSLLKVALDESSRRVQEAESAAIGAASAVTGYEELLKRNREKAVFIDTLKAARDMLHRDNIPRIILEETNGDINDSLETMLKGIDFKYPVYVTEAGDLEYDTETVTGRDARRLSGGQRYVLANILRVVFADVTDSHFPFLVLDEPTTCLDEASRAILAGTLQRMGDILGDRGNILIVPTHDEKVISGASHLIKI